MSRIGLRPTEIPNDVEVKVTEDSLCIVKGPKGELVEQMSKETIIRIEDNTIMVSRPLKIKRHKSLYGLTGTLVFNTIEGVTEGYKKTSAIKGIGCRAAKQDKKLVLNSGYLHTIEKEDPEGISVEIPEQYTLIISGINKQQAGNYATKIRDLRGPEPYKGKGIRYEDEHIRRKVGKTGK